MWTSNVPPLKVLRARDKVGAVEETEGHHPDLYLAVQLLDVHVRSIGYAFRVGKIEGRCSDVVHWSRHPGSRSPIDQSGRTDDRI